MHILIKRGDMLDTQNLFAITERGLCMTNDTTLTAGHSTFISTALLTQYNGTILIIYNVTSRVLTI
jgi:hypothetical protein